MLRGEIWLINLDPTIGAEIKKTRPAVRVTPRVTMTAVVPTLKGLHNNNGGLARCLNHSQRCGVILYSQPKIAILFFPTGTFAKKLINILQVFCANMIGPTLVVGGVADHVHVLFALSKNHSIAEIVYEVKRGSSKWIKTKGPEFKKFHWQSGYGAFSVSQSHVEQVRRYIEGQERHHRRITFEDEFREFLRRYEVEFDERYLWD